MRVIGGLIIVALGTLAVLHSEWLLRNFGRISWFEKNLGTEGGTRLGYKLSGIVIIFLGLIMTFGMMDGFLRFILSPLIGAGQ